MAIRGFIKNIITLYLAYAVIKIALLKQEITNIMIIAAALTIILSAWFLAEYIGVIPKCT